MPEPSWSYTGWWGGSTPSTKLLPQSDYFNQLNSDLWNNPAMSAPKLGELWRARYPATPTQPIVAAPVAATATPVIPPLSLTHLAPTAAPTATVPTYQEPAPVTQVPILPEVGSLQPTKDEITNAIALSNLVNQNTQDYYNKANPHSAAIEEALGREAERMANRQLSDQQLWNLHRLGAELGITTGSMGPSTTAAMIRQGLFDADAGVKEASDLRTAQMSRTPAPADVTKFMTPTDTKVQLAVEQFRAQNNRFTEQQRNDLQRELEKSRREGTQISDDARNQLALILKQMELNGDDKNRANQLLISELNNAAGNYRAGLGEQGSNYRANLGAQTALEAAALRYPQKPSYDISGLLAAASRGPFGGGQSTGTRTGGLPTFDEVFGQGGNDLINAYPAENIDELEPLLYG